MKILWVLPANLSSADLQWVLQTALIHWWTCVINWLENAFSLEISNL